MTSLKLKVDEPLKLLSDVSSANKIQSTANKEICGVCHLNSSVYVCPSCNLPYCCLSCYKSAQHGECSDKFLTQQLKDAADDSVDPSQRRHFLNKLRNHYQQSADDDFENLAGGRSDDDDDDNDTLLQRLSSIDLDHSAPDDILNALTQSEKDQFHDLLLPANQSQLSQLLQQQLQPWFNDFDPTSFINPFSITSIPVVQGGENLSPNLVAIVFAYAYILRRYSFNTLSSLDNIAADLSSAKKDITQLLPFIFQPLSKFVYSNPTEALESIWSAVPSQVRSSHLYTTLIQDTKLLLGPPQLVRQDDTLLCCLCLFDLMQVFGKAKTPAVTKLRFYLTRSHSMTSSLEARYRFTSSMNR
ncbi:hypothetical protein E3P99_02485 [Wallemia hederae]|uniref:HIT-type domain-containing protein n=1 Tax=Wallemia hederae TaxID=1540922 RepID=A0A4T0FK48_9BASI|nr:hypothetical protein E3P99_02485 [Wallemia hederae]